MKIIVEASSIQELQEVVTELGSLFSGKKETVEVKKSTIAVPAKVAPKKAEVEEEEEDEDEAPAKVAPKVPTKIPATAPKTPPAAPKVVQKAPAPAPAPKAVKKDVYEAPDAEEGHGTITQENVRALHKEVLEYGDEAKAFVRSTLKSMSAASLTLLPPAKYGEYYEKLQNYLEDISLD